VGLAPVPPRWDWLRGGVGLLRAGALWFAVVFLASAVASGFLTRVVFPTTVFERAAFFAANLLSGAAVFLFANRFLFRASGQTAAQALGLRVARPELALLGALGVAVLALDWIALFAIDGIASYLPITDSWAESFVEDIVFGRGATFAMSAIEIVVVAAVVEEFVFRGLLFNTLRLRLPFWTAALAAGLVFAGLHGYGWLGTSQVLASGVLFAWAFESSGSLWTSVVAHAAYNATILGHTILFLR
jgi:membrane protease YdiL (CAAX protease family)